MGSIVPFQDLNLLPDPLVTPKIEPKLEPFDEEQHHSTFYPNPTNPSSINSTDKSINSPSPLQELFPVPENPPPLEQNNDVISEFNRISELFRSAFAKKMQSYGDVEVSTPDSSSRAIVPRVEEDNRVSTVVINKPKKDQPRSSEMVRVSALGAEDQRYFRDLVRRSRMLYEALRIYSVREEENGRLMGGFGKRMRGDLRAASLMKEHGLWLHRDKRIIGSIPGVYVGDSFFFRMELCAIGLHGQAQAGIDYVPASQSANGEPVATSIIVSGGYEDDEDAGDVIIYTGHGGQLKHSARQCVHQTLDGGNLALERSMYYGIEIRVIRGLKHEKSPSNKIYVYDGLYRVIDSWFDIGKSGFGVYKYKLVRMPDQIQMGTTLYKFSFDVAANPLAVRRSGCLSLDISNRKETVPVSLFNDIDSDQGPLFYDYLVRSVYPPFAVSQTSNATGCDCVAGCSDGCYCAQRNGGELPYDRSGLLVRGKPVLFECGPFCSCPPSCQNRVTQKGVKHRLEVFRSRDTGWGVRSLDMIPAGSFICEYTGVVLTRQQAVVLSMNGDGLIYPGRFTERWAEWGDLSQVFQEFVRPMYPSIPPLDFAMDVSRMRNVACYMSQSSSPNVVVQYVLYDHNNVMYPHLMLFAVETIPPSRELSLDYGVAEDEWEGKLAICN